MTYDSSPFLRVVIFSAFLISLFWILPFQAVAGTPTPVSGFAWSENIGWIKFNHSAPSGQVQLDDETGVFSGYAWSENIGWIWFAPTDIPPGEAAANPAKLTGNEVSGWARACAVFPQGSCSGALRPDSERGGWEGWIRLDGVSLNTTPNPAEFQGYAWGGGGASVENAVVGWISFNRVNCDPDKDGFSNGVGDCPAAGTPISDYKVYIGLPASNQPPVVSNPSETWNHCSIQELSIPTFNWTYSDPGGAPQGAAYQIKIYGETTLDETVNGESGKSTSYTPLTTWIRDNLIWDTTYTWQVRVQDSPGAWSDWSNSRSFGMPDHAYPWIDSSFWVDPNPPAGFKWDPRNPGINETTTFTDLSIVYGGAAKSSCSWSFTDADPSSFSPAGPDPCSQKPETKFLSTGEKPVTLTVTDSHGYTCSGTKKVNARLPLPEWREIPPFSWINKVFTFLNR